MGSRPEHGRPARLSAGQSSQTQQLNPDPGGGKPPCQRVSLSRQIWRLTRLCLHLCEGLLRVMLQFPWLDTETRRRMRQRWSTRILHILGIEVIAEGAAARHGCLLVANHVSWLDIFVINSLLPVGFISKAEVRHWPAIGWLAARNDTVFLHRGNRHHADQVGREIATRLRAGENVALFPEGRTTDGTQVLMFHAKLLQPAITFGCPIQAMAIRYRTSDDHRCAAAAYHGGTSLWESVRTIVAQPRIVARVSVMAPVTPEAESDRRDVANALRARIANIVQDGIQPPT